MNKIIVALILLFCSGLANAGIVTLDWEGTSRYGHDVIGSITYDDATTDIDHRDYVGYYPGAPVSYEVAVSSHNFNGSWTDQAYSWSRVIVYDDPIIDTFYSAIYSDNGRLSLQLWDTGNDALISDDLPTISGLSMDDWTHGYFSFKPNGWCNFDGSITSIKHRVPEPGTGLLLGVGLILVGLFGYLGGRNKTRH